MSFSNDMPLLVNQLPISVDFPKEQEKFLETLSLLYKRIANAVNTKEGGLFSIQELFNSQQYFVSGVPNTFRNVYRKTFDLVNLNGGNIAGGVTVSFPHNITGLKYSTLIYASCTSVIPTFFTVVYPSVYLDTTNVNFTNPLPAIALNAVYVVAEYLKT